MADTDEVVGMVTVEDFSKTVLVVSEKGFGKRTYLRPWNRWTYLPRNKQRR